MLVSQCSTNVQYTQSNTIKGAYIYVFQSVTKMIQEACTYVEKTPNLDTKLKLIDTLRTVTAGKVSI